MPKKHEPKKREKMPCQRSMSQKKWWIKDSPYLQKFQSQEREAWQRVRKAEKNTHRLAQFWSKSDSSLHGSGVWLNNIHKVSVHFSSSIPITPDKAHRGRMSKKANLLKEMPWWGIKKENMSDLRESFEEQSYLFCTKKV
jgi:hypothetical protein